MAVFSPAGPEFHQVYVKMRRMVGVGAGAEYSVELSAGALANPMKEIAAAL